MTMSMTRKALLAGWLVLPLGAWAYHEGPGQDLKRLDDVGEVLDRAATHVAAARWLDAIDTFDEALKSLPAERADDARRIRLERSKAQMQASGLPDAHADLRDLVDELVADQDADPELLRDARAAFASSQYYMTWLMRLEGQPRDKWGPEVESARQTYRLLAEDATARGDAAASTRAREDLEAAVKLARMDLNELQGLPLPSQ